MLPPDGSPNVSPVTFFVLLSLVSSLCVLAMARRFPECLFQRLIQGVLYVAAAVLMAVGVFVGMMARFSAAP